MKLLQRPPQLLRMWAKSRVHLGRRCMKGPLSSYLGMTLSEVLLELCVHMPCSDTIQLAMMNLIRSLYEGPSLNKVAIDMMLSEVGVHMP